MQQDSDKLLLKNTISYLRDISEAVPNTLDVLKSYYAAKYRISEFQTSIFVAKDKNKSQAKCPRCCFGLREIGSSCAVKAESRKSKFARKVIKKLNESKSLTKFQKKYMKRNDLKTDNYLIVTCNFCRKVVKFPCKKPVKTGSLPNLDTKLQKKKKKKRDKSCGLKINGMPAQTKGNNNNTAQTTSQAKVPIIKKHKKEKNIRMLCNLLNVNSNLKPSTKNNLMQFLHSIK